MKRGKRFLAIIAIILIILVIIFLFSILIRGFFGGEDSWIKDSKGVYIPHGNPSDIPLEVSLQKQALTCANDLYINASINNVTFDSQCLGKCGDYSVDIVHSPRTSEDDLLQNQCSDYRSGITKKFIELDIDGRVVRIV